MGDRSHRPRWRQTFNVERPHEALGLTPPAAPYTASPRRSPRRLPALEYPAHVELRRVDGSGMIRWHSERLFLSHVLIGEYVSLEETGDAEWTIALGPLRLGHYCAREAAFIEAVAWSPPLTEPRLDSGGNVRPRRCIRLCHRPATVSPIIPV